MRVGRKVGSKHAANGLAYKILPWPQFIRQASQDGPQALLHFRIAYAQAGCQMLGEKGHQPLHGKNSQNEGPCILFTIYKLLQNQ